MDNKTLLKELADGGFLSEEDAKKLLQESTLARKNADELIYEKRSVPEEDVAKAKSKLLGAPYKKLETG